MAKVAVGAGICAVLEHRRRPRSLRLCPKPGDTRLPCRDFYFGGNQPPLARMRLSYPTAVGLATQAIVGVLKVAEHDRLQKIIHVTRARRVTASILHACSSPDPWIPSHTRMFDRYLDFFSLTTANFAISGSDGLTFLLVDSASKTRVFFFGIILLLVSQPQSVCYQGLARITSMDAPACTTAYKATRARVL